MSFNDSWSKKELKNECRLRGITYQGLNKYELIDELNSHDELNPHVDHSWTKKELKAECRSRGLRNFSRLTKDSLIELLNTGTTSAFTGTVPWNRRDMGVEIGASELLVDAREAARMGQWAAAIQGFETYLDQHYYLGDAAWQDHISSELDQCVSRYEQERREAEERRADLERREAEWRRETERRREEEARAAAAEAQARRDAEYEERLRAAEARAAAARAAEARAAEARAAAARAAEAEERREAQRRREAEYRERLQAAEARAAAAADQLATAEEQLRVAAAEAAEAEEDKERRRAELHGILPATAGGAWLGRREEAGARGNELRGIAPGRGSWSIGSASPGEVHSSSGAAQAGADRSVPGRAMSTLRQHNNINSSSNTTNSTTQSDCSICMDAKVNCALVPCGHHSFCFECAAGFDQCPVCRRNVTMKLQTFGA